MTKIGAHNNGPIDSGDSTRSGASNGKEPDASVDGAGSDAPDPLDGPPTLDETAQALIGAQLKALYGGLVSQGVPEHLLRLLSELELKERES